MMKSAFFGNSAPTSTAIASTTPADRAVLPAPTWPNQLPHRPVRFPSSRKFLWDRTPLGRVEIIELKDYLPVISVSSDLHQRLPTCTSTLAAVICPNGRQLHVTVSGSSATQNPAVESLTVTVASGAGGQELVRGLVQTLHHSLDRRGPAQLSTMLALALSLTASGHAAEGGTPRSSQAGCASATLTATLLVPATALTLTPLYSKRLCDVPLAQSLAQSQLPVSKVQAGYLTMDQARSLLPLAADDANVYSMPLVGVWVHGAKGLEHPAVYAAALKYAYGSSLPDLITQPDGAFLLLLFTGDSPVARCYEARFADSSAAQPGERRTPPATPSSATTVDTGLNPQGRACGLRLLPYQVRAELAGQTSAPLELTPVLDAVTAAALGPLLTLPPPASAASSTQPPQRGVLPGAAPSAAANPYGQAHGHGGYGSRPGTEVGVGSAYGKYEGISQLRGSGSKLMTSPSKAMKIFAQGGSTTTSGGASRYTTGVAVVDSGYGWSGAAAAGQLQAGGRGEPEREFGAVLGLDSQQRDSPPVPRSAAVPTPFRFTQGHASGGVNVADGGNSDGKVGNTPPKDPRLQHRSGTGYPAAEKTTLHFDPTTDTGRNDISITDSLQARQSLTQLRTSQPGGCRNSGDWREHISGVMSTPGAALGGRTQCARTEWDGAQPPQSQQLSQQQQHYRHCAPLQQPWQIPATAAAAAQQPGLQQRFTPDQSAPTSSTQYSGNVPPPRGALGSTTATESGASPAETPRLQAEHLRRPSFTGVPPWQAGGHAQAMHSHLQLNRERPSTALGHGQGSRIAGRPSIVTSISGADSTRLPSSANQSLDAWLKQVSGYPAVPEQSETLWNSSSNCAVENPGPEAAPYSNSATDCAEAGGRVTLPRGGGSVKADVPRTEQLNGGQTAWLPTGQHQQGPSNQMGDMGGYGREASCQRSSYENPPQLQDRQEHGGNQSAESSQVHHGYSQQHLDIDSQYQRPQLLEQAAAEDDEDLPSDPVLLRQEVLFLRRQVASLQDQLRRMASTQGTGPQGSNHRPGLTSSAQHPGAVVSPGCFMSSSTYPPAQQLNSVEAYVTGEPGLGELVTGNLQQRHSATQDSCNGQFGHTGHNGGPWSVHEEALRQQPHQHGYDNTHESQHPSGSQSRPDSRGLASEAGHGLVNNWRGAPQPGIDAPISGTAAAIDSNNQSRRNGNAVEDGIMCVPTGRITAVSLATGTASDRVGRTSMSTASDRGSVWSMASLRSSIMSYKSYRSAGTVHSSACTSDAGAASTATHRNRAEPGPGITSQATSVGMQQSMPVTEPTSSRANADSGVNGISLASDATTSQGVNAAGVDKAGQQGFYGTGCRTADAQALASTSSIVVTHGVKHLRATGINGLDFVYDSGGGRRRRRVRRASSDSESELSMASEPDDVTGGHSAVTEVTRRTYADRPSTDTQSNALGARCHNAMVVGTVVRTKYVPLDEESESSDAESELLLMQKYGIRA